MRCKTKQRKGSRPDLILGYRRTTFRDCGTGSWRNPGEINDHPVPNAFGVRQNSAYRHRNYEGRFRKRRRPSLFYERNLAELERDTRCNCAFTDCSRPLAAQVRHRGFVFWRICSLQVRRRTDSLRRAVRSPFGFVTLVPSPSQLALQFPSAAARR